MAQASLPFVLRAVAVCGVVAGGRPLRPAGLV